MLIDNKEIFGLNSLLLHGGRRNEVEVARAYRNAATGTGDPANLIELSTQLWYQSASVDQRIFDQRRRRRRSGRRREIRVGAEKCVPPSVERRNERSEFNWCFLFLLQLADICQAVLSLLVCFESLLEK